MTIRHFVKAAAKALVAFEPKPSRAPEDGSLLDHAAKAGGVVTVFDGDPRLGPLLTKDMRHLVGVWLPSGPWMDNDAEVRLTRAGRQMYGLSVEPTWREIFALLRTPPQSQPSKD